MIEENFGDRLRKIRKKKVLRQDELAAMVGVATKTLQRWEYGETTPRADDIAKLCEVLHVTESELLNGPNDGSWELKLIFRKGGENKGGIIDMSGNTISATLSIGDNAMSVELGASFEIWEDDAKFEDLIGQLRAKRTAGLKVRKEGWESLPKEESL